jgi:hypothetical protein
VCLFARQQHLHNVCPSISNSDKLTGTSAISLGSVDVSAKGTEKHGVNFLGVDGNHLFLKAILSYVNRAYSTMKSNVDRGFAEKDNCRY